MVLSCFLVYKIIFVFQIIGFILLVIGMGLYNDVFAALGQKFAQWHNRNAGPSDTDALISQPADESEPTIGSGPGPNP
jgi:hypothetical protein